MDTSVTHQNQMRPDTEQNKHDGQGRSNDTAMCIEVDPRHFNRKGRVMTQLLQTKIEQGPPTPPPKIALNLFEPDDDGWGVILWVDLERIYVPLSHTLMSALLELVDARISGAIRTPLDECSGGSRQNAQQIVRRLRQAIDAKATGLGNSLIRTCRPWHGFRLDAVTRITRSEEFFLNRIFFGDVVTRIVEFLGDEGSMDFD